jgi:hypothetical protein
LPFRPRISAWWTSRSITAAGTTSSPKISSQAENGLLEVTIVEAEPQVGGLGVEGAM